MGDPAALIRSTPWEAPVPTPELCMRDRCLHTRIGHAHKAHYIALHARHASLSCVRALELVLWSLFGVWVQGASLGVDSCCTPRAAGNVATPCGDNCLRPNKPQHRYAHDRTDWGGIRRHHILDIASTWPHSWFRSSSVGRHRSNRPTPHSLRNMAKAPQTSYSIIMIMLIILYSNTIW